MSEDPKYEAWRCFARNMLEELLRGVTNSLLLSGSELEKALLLVAHAASNEDLDSVVDAVDGFYGTKAMVEAGGTPPLVIGDRVVLIANIEEGEPSTQGEVVDIDGLQHKVLWRDSWTTWERSESLEVMK